MSRRQRMSKVIFHPHRGQAREIFPGRPDYAESRAGLRSDPGRSTTGPTPRLTRRSHHRTTPPSSNTPQPRKHRRGPQLAVLRLQHPVPLVGKIKPPRRHAFPLQRRKQTQPLVQRHAEIQLVVDHPIWRLELRGVLGRRPFFKVRTLPRNPAVPLVEPRLLCRPLQAHEIVNAAGRDARLELVHVPLKPIYQCSRRNSPPPPPSASGRPSRLP